MFAEAVIVFIGVAGNHHQAVERQLAPVLDHAGVNELVLPAADLAAIVRHTDASRDIIRKLHVDGVIGGALITSGGQQAFRLVIYDGTGHMRSLGETPLAANKLTSGDLEVLGINLTEEITSMQGAKAPDVVIHPQPAHVAAPAPVPIQVPPPTPVRVVATKAAPPPTAAAEIEMDAEKPAEHAAAPKQVADESAVSLDDIEAATGGDPADTGGSLAATAAPPTTLHLHIDAGLGITGRVFSAPASVTGYTTTPVSTVRFAAGLAPTARTTIDVLGERTLSMSTSLDSNTMASTSISRWQVGGGYMLVDGGVQITADLGLGHRAFTIDASETARTPDAEYSYVAIGMQIAKPIGESVVLRGGVELEPVFGGAEPTQMELGKSSRWGLDVGAACELNLIRHLVARAAFDYQRFSWAWDAAGARAAGGASDSYPSATIGLRTAF